MLSKEISGAIVTYWKAVPIVAMLLVWMFFTGFRSILKTREHRLLRELLLCLFCFGMLFALLCYGSYGLVDPANGLARRGAVPVDPHSLERFALMGSISFFVALISGVLLEWQLWKTGEVLKHGRS